ncbi:hypothetical protein EIP91_001593 [Steccherinum ochraceum]|uniref:Cytochrome P450 n=1 Tax=Steccherinum ochraceum TaxID=92696 RepID=A0A4R0RUC6_9APHY|nr:hypothetical protein EIP91_001593 [Steccherinum ochraceum]
MRVPTQPFILLGSVEAATELLDRKSGIYSDRIEPIMMQLMRMTYNVASMPYAPKWRAHRRMFDQQFRLSEVHNFKAIQLKQARRFLSWVLSSPACTQMHTRRFVTAIIFLITYGRKITDMDDEHVVLVEAVARGTSAAVLPGAFFVEFMPWLKFLPKWIPGQAFRKHADHYAPLINEMRDRPFADVQAALDAGNAPTSWARTLIERARATDGGSSEGLKSLDLEKNVTAFAYAAAADTTASTIQSFLLAMALFPDAQRRAQVELDEVVGPTRLPDFDDIEQLSFIRAIMMETLRWIPVTPIGIPHAVTADDEYKGQYIPKGSMIIPNVWTMMRNADDYPDPDAFQPGRFLDKDGNINTAVQDPTTIAFGFGRRICPGRHFAINSLLIFMASTLHVFDVTPGLDADGKPVELTDEVLGEVVAMPRHVPCGFSPRFPGAERLVREAAGESDDL